MESKFSVLLTTVALAAAIPPVLSYLPQTSSLFSVTSPAETKPQLEPISQQVPYSNSVNQLNDLTQRQKAEMDRSVNSNDIQWRKPQTNSDKTVHQVGFMPSEQPQPEQYYPVQPITQAPPSVSTVEQAPPVQVIGSPTPSTVVYYSEVPGQVVHTHQGVGVVSGPIPVVPNTVVQRNLTGLEFWFRFDITPAWVEQNWDFVTACVGPMNLQGYRVSLVTGSSPDDLTGVLTYYFDNHKQLQQIQFQGTTGHLGRLTAMLRQQFHMSQRIANDPSLTIYETPASFRGPKNIMEARAPMVIKSDQLYHRFEVYLQLNRPVEKTGLFW